MAYLEYIQFTYCCDLPPCQMVWIRLDIYFRSLCPRTNRISKPHESSTIYSHMSYARIPSMSSGAFLATEDTSNGVKRHVWMVVVQSQVQAWRLTSIKYLYECYTAGRKHLASPSMKVTKSGTYICRTWDLLWKLSDLVDFTVNTLTYKAAKGFATFLGKHCHNGVTITWCHHIEKHSTLHRPEGWRWWLRQAGRPQPQPWGRAFSCPCGVTMEESTHDTGSMSLKHRCKDRRQLDSTGGKLSV